MAIYHLSMQIISRSKGQSAVAAASYRSGEKLKDERTGETKFYARDVQPETMILAPSNSPSWVTDREALWNEVEKAEKRKDSQLCREINVALPVELSHSQQERLVRNFVQKEFVDRGMVGDIAIHRDDKNNPHAHIMLTMRTIDKKGFGKKNRDWNSDFSNSKESAKGFVKGSESCLNIREQWANHVNHALEKAGIQEQITHLSHKDRGLEELPTIHLGHVAGQMEKKGIQSDRGNINREREAYNQAVVDLNQYRAEKKALEEKMKSNQRIAQALAPEEKVAINQAHKYLKDIPTLIKIAQRLEQLDKWEQRINNNDKYLRWKTDAIQTVSESYRSIDSSSRAIQQEQQEIKNIQWKNPFKIKENRQIEANSQHIITRHQENILAQNEKIAQLQGKLDFKDRTQFESIKKLHEDSHYKSLTSNQSQRKSLNEERKVLLTAQKVVRRIEIAKVGLKYPENPEMAYMDFKTASNINYINSKNNRIVSIDEMRYHHEKWQKSIMQGKNDGGKLEEGVSLLNGILEGLAKANMEMTKEQTKQKQKQRYRGQKQQEIEHEL